MSMEGSIFLALFVAVAVSAIVTFAVWKAALRRQILIDSPNQRSSHEQPKPRGGGVGVTFGLAAGLAIAASGHSFDRAALLLVLGALVCAALGLWDDVRGLAVGPRLAAEFAVSALLVYETGPLVAFPLPAPLDVPLGMIGFVFPVVWLVGVTNFFNFMDGIDGLAAGQAIAVSLMVAVAAWSQDARLIAVVLVGALAGFVPFNWWPSRIFLGDGGSLPIGFLLAGLPLLAPSADRPRAVLVTAMGLTLFLLDPVLTLWRRWRRGAPLGQAHREHLYQQLLDPADPHRSVASALVVAGLGLSGAGWLVYLRPSLGWVGVVAAALAFGAESLLAQRRSRR